MAKKKVKKIPRVCCEDGTLVRIMDPTGRGWETAANRIAREYVTIVACGHCGYPRPSHYKCERCGYE